MTRWPWISLTVSALLVASPLGVDLIQDAFWAGEGLVRAIAQPILMIAAGVMLLIVAAEYLLRRWLKRRR